VESVLDVECYGENSGGLNITVSGGTPDYQFQLYYNGTPVGLPQMLTNEPVDLIANYSQLGAGTYTYLISDYYGCEFEDSVEINSPQAINPTITSYNLPCNGGFGLINISSLSNIDGTPGQTGFNISWTGTSSGNPSGIEIPSSSFPNYDIDSLIAGTYQIQITDSVGCAYTQNNINILQPQTLSSQHYLSTNGFYNINCYGNSATDSLIVSGGNAPYNVSWQKILPGPPGATTSPASATLQDPWF
jgi:hypothetical protein